ncbi:MAG: outer membrane lipoprotein carrier protein LolA [Rhodospirillales bacterium]|nr:outer membrane lipoprotein carrier protein LolA [Rhodospirillales bacterium]
MKRSLTHLLSVITPARSCAAVFLAAFCLFHSGAASLAQESSASGSDIPPLNGEDLSDIARIESYLNAITTMKARFIQMTSTGQTSEGDILLWRPGRLRIDYDPPSPVVITSNGVFLVYHDTELDQLSHIPLSSTPAGVLVDEAVSLNNEDMAVTNIRRGANTLDVTLIQRDDPYAGQITLVFSDRPLRLQRWVLLDAQGVTSNFAIIGAQIGVSFDPALFITKAAKAAKKPKDR